MDSALSFAASKDDPASGGRHKVWGSEAAVGAAADLDDRLAPAQGVRHRGRDRAGARASAHTLPIPDDSIAICSFGDASRNHATAQTAFNAAQWTAYQKLPAPVLFVCEDNGIGISVKTPDGWIAQCFRDRAGPRLFLRRRPRSRRRLRRGRARGLSLPHDAAADVPAPAHDAHHGPRGHRFRDRMAQRRGARGGRGDRSAAALGGDRAGIGPRYEGFAARASTRRSARSASPPPRRPIDARSSTQLAEVIAPLAPYTPDKVDGRSRRAPTTPTSASRVFGGEAKAAREPAAAASGDPDQPRAARPLLQVSGDAAVRRGRRAEGRRLHGHQGPAQGVPERARVQHAARRDR